MTLAAPYLDEDAAALLAQVAAPRRALFLDRDGVINIDHGYVHAPAQVEWVDGIFDLCRAARAASWLPIVVTNQAGIARGYYGHEQFLALTAWMHARFREQGAPLLATYYCPHHPTAGVGPLLLDCGCRKPRPGMLLEAAARFDLQLADSLLLGDTPSDLQAAKAAGVGRARLFEGGRLPAFDALFD